MNRADLEALRDMLNSARGANLTAQVAILIHALSSMIQADLTKCPDEEDAMARWVQRNHSSEQARLRALAAEVP